MNKLITILGFAGSLRKRSYNKALLHAAAELLPKDTKLKTFDLEGIPPSTKTLRIKRRPKSTPSSQKSGLQMPY